MDETASEGASATPAHADLLSRLEVIEAQPLATRAAAYAAVHDELAHRLEAGPTATSPTSPGP
jgi:hypothetical protein